MGGVKNEELEDRRQKPEKSEVAEFFLLFATDY